MSKIKALEILKPVHQMQNTHNKRILVAPLNWGLGHATRCIPIINALMELSFEPIVASDGDALELLRKEFPKLNTLQLPSYNITYSKKAKRFKLKLLKDSPHFLKTIQKEKKEIKRIVEKENITGIISDNRFGARHDKIPCVFVTHQLRVLSGNTTWISSKLHQNIISKFDECWVPDYSGPKNLSGDLGHLKAYKHPIKYIGPLSRFKKIKLESKYDLMVLLSGPEPQRSYLEEQLLEDLKHYKGNVLFVRGKIEPQQKHETKNNVLVYNFMTRKELEIGINESDLVLSRSGYTTLMDLAKLEKKAFFIPTPGQFEQEYLAKKLNTERVAPYAPQAQFNLKMLSKVDDYNGFKLQECDVDFNSLFRLF